MMAVVKANAYGHGLVPMSRELEMIGTDWLGVANVVEGAMLREAGVRLPILLLSATLPEEMDEAFKFMALTRGYDSPLSGFALQDLRHLL